MQSQKWRKIRLAILDDSVLEGQCVSKALFSKIATDISHSAEQICCNFLLIRISKKTTLCTFTELVSNSFNNPKEN